MGLAGLLIGGAVSFHRQKLPRVFVISFGVLALLALVAAYLLTLAPQ
ncbi:hypothetical protein BJ994_001054 [Arthrobacter pigmenti]|uniref:Uncharacterized protein n=1 Tax=Arthrobacter pigmenti TaxID=271432 RepID=A0A846RFM2_9MICC|nr:hypothetical protein [Arthrobacter pigmenti]NJC21978.1 hypothetical protein [Arthrobacter pigmenti]